MNPLIAVDLVALRERELRREAAARRLSGSLATSWDHPWRRGLGERLEHWGRRLQAEAGGPASRPTTG